MLFIASHDLNALIQSLFPLFSKASLFISESTVINLLFSKVFLNACRSNQQKEGKKAGGRERNLMDLKLMLVS